MDVLKNWWCLKAWWHMDVDHNKFSMFQDMVTFDVQRNHKCFTSHNVSIHDHNLLQLLSLSVSKPSEFYLSPKKYHNLYPLHHIQLWGKVTQRMPLASLWPLSSHTSNLPYYTTGWIKFPFPLKFLTSLAHTPVTSLCHSKVGQGHLGKAMLRM